MMSIMITYFCWYLPCWERAFIFWLMPSLNVTARPKLWLGIFSGRRSSLLV